MADDDLKARREAAEKALEARKRVRDQELEAREVALLEARVAYGDKFNGAEGEAFVVFDAGAEGPIVLKPGAMVLYKEYRAKVLAEEITLEAAQKYILPCVESPDRVKMLDILTRRPALHDDLVVALHRLHGANEGKARGKS